MPGSEFNLICVQSIYKWISKNQQTYHDNPKQQQIINSFDKDCLCYFNGSADFMLFSNAWESQMKFH